jgi:hypothetical protein
VSEKISQLPLFTQFIATAPKTAQVDDIAKAQLLVSTLGDIHAISNPIGLWQTIKGTFAFLGNRKGQLTPTANERIFAAITGSCSASVAATVKAHMLQRSKQVKTGIQTTNGPKSFTAFGTKELATFVNIQPVVMFNLTELKPLSVALNGAALQSHQQVYHVHRQSTMQIEVEAKKMLRAMVNPVDEDKQ